MKPTLDEQDISVYATDAQTIQEPQGSDYSQGVAVGRTVPAKWWNWLFKAATSRLHQVFMDITSIFTELKNLILDAGLTPSGADDTQVIQAVVVKADTQIDQFVLNKRGYIRSWDTNSVAEFVGNNSIFGEGVVDGVAFSAYGENRSGLHSILYLNIRDIYGEWHSFDDGFFPSNISSYKKIALLHYKDYYYIWEEEVTWSVFSKDFRSFERFGIQSYTVRAMFTAAGKLYALTVPSGAGSSTLATLWKTEDNINWESCGQQTVTAAYNIFNHYTALTSFEAGGQTQIPVVRDAVKLGNKYYVGEFYLQNDTLYPATADITSFKTLNTVNTPVSKLQNGNIFIASSTATNSILVIDKDSGLAIPTQITVSLEYCRWFETPKVLCWLDGGTLYYSTDCITGTAVVVPAYATLSNISDITYADGWFYCGKGRTQDFTTWEDLSTLLPDGTTNVQAFEIQNSTGVVVAVGLNQYVSLASDLHIWSAVSTSVRNMLRNSVTGLSLINGKVSTAPYAEVASISNAITYLGTNRVLGNTLYLR